MATAARFIHLTAAQDEALRELEVSPVVNAKVRLRASIIRLNNTGWSAPKLAQHFGRNLQSVHNDLNVLDKAAPPGPVHRFENFGFEGLADGKATGTKPKATPEKVPGDSGYRNVHAHQARGESRLE